MPDVFEKICNRIIAIERPHPVCVAIDGIDAAGKTTLANMLASLLRERGRSIIRASIDSFHNPREIRQQRGSVSPEGYFYDCFNYELLQSRLLIPLRQNQPFQTGIFDYRTEKEIEPSPQTADKKAMLLFDGGFLLRPELIDFWDFKIFVEISFETCLKRALLRDRELFGSENEVLKRYQQRYIPGQKLYLESCHPKEKADIVLDNNNPENPVIL